MSICRPAVAAVAASALCVFALALPVNAELTAQLTDGVSPAVIDIPLPTQTPLFRLRKRPELLYQAWDDTLDENITELVTNPLYQGSGQSGNNPLHTSDRYIVTVPSATLTYLHKDGIVHRDIAARMTFTVPGESSPLLIADVLFALDDSALPGSNETPDDSVLLGLWAGKQTAPALLTFPDGSPTGETLAIAGASWSFEIVAVPAPAAGTIGLLGLIVAAGRRRTR